MNLPELRRWMELANKALEHEKADVEIVGPPEAVAFLFYGSPTRVMDIGNSYDSLHATAVRLAKDRFTYFGAEVQCDSCYAYAYNETKIRHTPTCSVGVVMSLEGK